MNTMIASSAKWFGVKDGATDVDFIRAHEEGIKIPDTATFVEDGKSVSRQHCPISSALILESFRKKAVEKNLTLVDEKAALSRNGGLRYMYTANIVDDKHPDYALSIGFRNFSDKTLAFSGMCGTSIFVCENGCCSSIVKPSRMRHTFGNIQMNPDLLDSKIESIFIRFFEDSPRIHEQIELLKSTPLNGNILGHIIRKLNGSWEKDKTGEYVFKKNPLVGSANLCRIMADLENPAYNSHEDSSCFRLLNACTKVTTHEIKNPLRASEVSRYLNNLILKEINPDFIPLGDVVDVEVEEE